MNFKSSKIRWVMALSFALVVALAIIFTITSIHGARASGPTIASDQADYAPGSTVTLTGAGWASGEKVHIYVNDSVGNTWSLDSGQNGAADDPVAADNGGFTYSFSLPNSFIANYSATATDTSDTSVTATTTFTDAPPAANLDQCANKGTVCDTSHPAQWQNGNLGQSQAIYFEGDSVPYRSRFTNLTAGATYTVTIGWDTTQGGLHALDYLTTYNRTVTTADPCSGFTCSATTNTLAIPADPNVTGAGVTPVAGNFTLFGGTFPASALSSYTLSGSYTGNSSTTITVTFVASSSNVVLAWGGHIATRADWGAGNSAVSISGSPYHMRLTTFTCSNVSNCSVGNQDRSLAAEAVIFPGSITIIKHASPQGSTSFPFTASPSPLTNFSLVDDGTSSNTKTFSNITSFQTYTVTENTPANWKLTGVVCSVTSPNGGTQTVSGATATINLKEGENVTCTYSNSLISKDLTVTKTAMPSFTRTYKWTITKKVDTTKQTIAAGGTATFNYTVEVTHDAGTDSGWTVSGTITVSNPNANFAVTGVNVTDAINNGGICSVTNGTSLTIPAGGSVTLNYTCTYASAPNPSSGTNTATATWPKDQGNGNSTPDSSATGLATADFGTATPTVVNGTITVVDDKTNPNSPVTLGTATYTQTSPIDFKYTLQLSGVGGTCTDYKNTATIKETGQTASQTVTVCAAKDLSVSKTATPSFTRTYTWTITKSVDKPEQTIPAGGTATFTYTVEVTHKYADSGWTVSGTITVTNPNDFEDVTLSDVTDSIDNGGSCKITSGSPTATVPKSGSVKLNYTCTYTSAPSPLSGTNTATATWDKTTASTPSGTASGTAGADFSQVTPTVVNGSITVVDDQAAQGNPVILGTVSYTDPSPFDFKPYTLTFPGKEGTCTNYTNTATIDGTTQTASQTVTVCVAKDLSVSKTANTAYVLTYGWKIAKSVDKTQQNIPAGGTATFNYTVEVTHDAGTQSGWTVSGTITVNNPNDFEDVTLSDVTDSIDNGGTCKIINGSPTATVPKSGSVTLDYSCTYDKAPDPSSGTNTATASWDKDKASTPTGSASGQASADFNNATVTVNNGIITVVDDKTDPKNPVLLGTVDAQIDSNPKDFTYPLDLPGKGGACTDYTNTATIDGTTQTASQTVTVCAAEDLTVSKDATPSFTRTYGWKIAKSVDKTQQNIPAGGTATFNYTVEVTHDSGTDSGWTVSGTITVNNPNDFEDVTLSNVTDSIGNGDTCKITNGSTTATVPKSGSVTLDYTCTYAKAPDPLTGTNTATATWDKATAATPSGSASGTASVDFSQVIPTVVDGTITVVDDKTDPKNPVTLGTATYKQDNPIDFKYALQLSGVGGTCTDSTNTATFTTNDTGATGSASQKVTVCVGEDLQVTKDATPSFTRTYTWGIKKSVDQTQQNIAAGGKATFNYTVEVTHDSGTDSGWTVSGTITVKNPNDWEAITANITDAVDNGGSCSVTNGTNVSVPASGSAQVPYSCTFTSGSSGNNTATATWVKATYFTPDGSASSVQVPFAFTTPTKVVNGSVNVSDTLGGSLGTVSYTDPSPFDFTPYTLTFPGKDGTCTDYTNTATFTTNDTGATGSASQTVKVCVGIDLSVSKTASASFTRTYAWSIAKSVDKTLVEQIGGTATFNYTVNVKETGFTDSGWQVNGTITVTNPNDWEAITVDVTDKIDNNGNCTVTGGSGVSVPASSSVSLSYNCTYSSAPNPSSGTNTATATWDSAKFFTPHGSALGTAGYAFTTPTTVINQDISVMDTFNGVTTPLGTLTATDGTPFASATYKYSHTVNVPTSNCVKYTNKAVIVETGQSDSKTVEVCGPAKTGALTMGFWQNKNGQGIISAADQTKLGNWLRQYHPFSDAPSSGLATYVYNIIKAATCTSTSNTCNSMLRAQMLATALDVYFSDSSLGGIQIKAPAAIGGVTIDLTKICAMIDGSGGTATCSGNYENVSSAFGGATSMTVQAMLLYQNTADPLADAGAVWYGQVKATQVLAKDAFDAINNQVAYGP